MFIFEDNPCNHQWFNHVLLKFLRNTPLFPYLLPFIFITFLKNVSKSLRDQRQRAFGYKLRRKSGRTSEVIEEKNNKKNEQNKNFSFQFS